MVKLIAQCHNKSMDKSVKNRRVAIFLALALMSIALILEIIPGSVISVSSRVCMDELGNTYGCKYYTHHSYFDFYLVAYGMVFPLITGLITIATIVILIIRIFKPLRLVKVTFILPLVGLGFSLLSFFFFGDENTFTIPGIIIIALFVAGIIVNILDNVTYNRCIEIQNQ